MNDLRLPEQPIDPPEGVTLTDLEETQARERAVSKKLSGPRGFDLILEALSEMPQPQINQFVACFVEAIDFGRFDDLEIAYLVRKQVVPYLLESVDMDKATADLLEGRE